MTQDQRFLIGLSNVLAHSMVYFSRCPGVRLFAGSDAPAPTASESTADMMQAYIKYLPELLRTTSKEVLPTEQALLDASKVTSPQQAELETSIYGQYGPQINKIASDIAAQNALAQAGSNIAVLKGPGQELAQAAVDAQKIADQPYYTARDQALAQLGKLFSSLDDPNAGLSGAERAEVERSIARREAGSGSLGTPSNLGTVEAAMNFGRAGEARKSVKQTAIANAVGTATSFLPAAKSGVDVFQTVTGRPSATNSGESRLSSTPTTAQTGSTTFGTANNLFGSISNLQQQANQINANRRTGSDVAQGWIGTMGCCWTFMAAYENQSLPWFVRAVRDAITNVEIGRGYKWMSHWLVPLMNRNRLVRQLVKSFMVGPLTIHAGYLVGEPGYEHGAIYRTHKRVWLTIWSILGRTIARS